MTRPADWQIQQIFFRAGAHLEKRPKWVAPVCSAPYMGSYVGGFSDDFKGYSVLTVLPADKGNLRNEEYRGLIGHPFSSSTFSQCRVCLKMLFTVEDRRTHGKNGCNTFLHEALKHACGVKLCLVCDKFTDRRTWGTPLCNLEACLWAWRFDVCQPLRLREYLLQFQERSNVKILEEFCSEES